MWGDLKWGVKVYIWEFDPRGLIGRGNVGHTSILICTDGSHGTQNKTTYLSWWPKGGEGGFGNMEHDRPRAYGARGKEATRDDHQDDQARVTDKDREEGSAKWKFRIEAGISPPLMHMFVDELIVGSVKTSMLAKPKAYNGATQNCSTTVAHCLRAGGADTYVKWPDHSIWTPNDVYRYVRNLTEAIASKYSGKARQVR
ncbi:MAG: hypothetical protein AB3X44_15515 [Leptothrix sp. (in: b-proteobacteria)]